MMEKSKNNRYRYHLTSIPILTCKSERGGVMGKIILLLFILGVSLFALDTQTLLKAHKEALQTYQSKDRNVSKSIELLKEADVSELLGKQPSGLSKSQYIHILNDYGFFLYKAKEYDKALSYFRKVLLEDPDRVIAYLNTADNYKKMYEKTNSNAYPLNAIQYYETYAKKIKPKQLSKEIQAFLESYKDVKLVPLSTNFLTDALSHVVLDKQGTIFKYSSEDEKKFCQNFVADANSKKNIQFIQPKIITNDLFDPEFVKLFPKHSEKLIISLGYKSNTPGAIVDQNTGAYTGGMTDFYPKNMKELEEWRERSNLESVRQMNIRFYDVDIDNNSSNGKGKLVFTEGCCYSGEHSVLNEELNKVTNRLTTYKKGGYNIPREYLEEVIKYKKNYYVLILEYNQNTGFYEIEGLRKINQFNSLNHICSFTKKGEK